MFPRPDGVIDLLPAPDGRADIVLGFTAHFVIAAPLGPVEIAERLVPGDFSAWMAAAFLMWVGERLGSVPTTFDALLVALGTGRARRRGCTKATRRRIRGAARVALSPGHADVHDG